MFNADRLKQISGLMSAAPLLGRVFLAHVFETLTDGLSLCVCFLVQSGVPGFLTDMQKACSNYNNYCQKK